MNDPRSDEVATSAAADALRSVAAQQLVARYVEAVALFDVELYRSVWTDDAVWYVDGRGEYIGPDAITELFARLRGRQEMAVQRVVSGRAECDAAGGRGRWVIHSLTRTSGKGAELVGIYEDTYRYVDDQMLFASRAFHPLYRGPIDLPGRAFAPPQFGPLQAR